MSAAPAGPGGAPARVTVVHCDWAGRPAPETPLGPRERAHAARLDGARRAEWVRTRLTAKAALLRAGGPPDAEILPDPGGAPRLHDPSGRWALSLAHTGELTACAVSRTGAASLVGVDVEPVDARNDILLPRLLGPDEPPRLGPGPRPPGLLATVLVAAKEAALKAYRRPSPALRAYRVRQDADGGLHVRVADAPYPALRVWWTCHAGLVTAVCAAGDRPPEQYAASADAVLTALAGPPVRGHPPAPRLP
ncbi:4'-phosphopantetheinyl transferase family protein [Streptomyces sp. NPDC056069]|uniref:4'-phosphopantetheinyl transferase family protein n=1 Tax=Streptomyces sp. NPDC056069 TaxID=3345702 RepID=UPI0035D7D662